MNKFIIFYHIEWEIFTRKRLVKLKFMAKRVAFSLFFIHFLVIRIELQSIETDWWVVKVNDFSWKIATQVLILRLLSTVFYHRQTNKNKQMEDVLILKIGFYWHNDTLGRRRRKHNLQFPEKIKKYKQPYLLSLHFDFWHKK